MSVCLPDLGTIEHSHWSNRSTATQKKELRTKKKKSLLVICTAEITCISSYSYLDNMLKKRNKNKKKIAQKKKHTTNKTLTYLCTYRHCKSSLLTIKCFKRSQSPSFSLYLTRALARWEKFLKTNIAIVFLFSQITGVCKPLYKKTLLSK